ncbi:MAG: winged helix-turn-helix domain-containing protein [Blastocatellia bacterium]
MSKRDHYEFGPFRLDARERLLLRDGESVSLTPKAFDLLLALIEHHGHLLNQSNKHWGTFLRMPQVSPHFLRGFAA